MFISISETASTDNFPQVQQSNRYLLTLLVKVETEIEIVSVRTWVKGPVEMKKTLLARDAKIEGRGGNAYQVGITTALPLPPNKANVAMKLRSKFYELRR